jgi:hypothetical protein
MYMAINLLLLKCHQRSFITGGCSLLEAADRCLLRASRMLLWIHLNSWISIFEVWGKTFSSICEFLDFHHLKTNYKKISYNFVATSKLYRYPNSVRYRSQCVETSMPWIINFVVLSDQSTKIGRYLWPSSIVQTRGTHLIIKNSLMILKT